jgi:L-iditol 2-dehydrogenase
MKAVVKTDQGPGHVRLMDVEPRVLLPGQVRVLVKAAGICGTDLHILHDTFPYNAPVILGHELSGKLVEIGADVEAFQQGDRVIVEPTANYCGTCPRCLQGQTNMCPERQVYGRLIDGGFAETMVANVQAVHRLPSNIDYATGAVVEPLAVCVHALMERTRIARGEHVLVLGPGPIGLLSALLAKAEGAIVTIGGTAKDEKRLQLASSLGMDHIVCVDKQDVWEAIRLTTNEGADKTVECAGHESALKDALRCTRKGGTLVQLGLFNGSVPVGFSDIACKELQVLGSFAHAHSSFRAALDLMGNNIVDVRPLISESFPLGDWEEGFRCAEAGEGVKILLRPTEAD